MKLSSVALSLALVAGSAVAADPLDTPACRQALAALHTAEDDLARRVDAEPNRPRGHAASVLGPLRRDAARRCLNVRDDQPARVGRLAEPPVAVSPPAVTPPGTSTPRSAVPTPLLPPPPPLSRPAPPVVVTTCDATGCWASDGSRLQRVGPQLLGPKGFCNAQGALLHCPP